MKVGLAYNSFYGAFKQYFPKLEVVDLLKDDVYKYDLIIFSGGEDINPSIYGEETISNYYNEHRDTVELRILERALSRKIKILGVCRGHQLINAYLGTRLVQDIGSKFGKPHKSYHPLEYITETSLIKYILKDQKVNSMHHQGFTYYPNNKLVMTSIHEKIVESCESENIITVQFHPEFFDNELGENFFEVIKEWVEDRKGLIKKVQKFATNNILERGNNQGVLLDESRTMEGTIADVIPEEPTSATTFSPTLDTSHINFQAPQWRVFRRNPNDGDPR